MELDLDELEAAETAMTAAPWGAHGGWGGVLMGPERQRIAAFDDMTADMRAVAILRNAAPDLTRRIREQDAEIARLRALCGDALEWIGNRQPDIAPESLVYLMARLRAASKGEQ